MVAGQGITPPRPGGGAAHHVGKRPVVLDKIQVHRGQGRGLMAQVAGQGEGLQEDLRDDHRGPQVDIDPVGRAG